MAAQSEEVAHADLVAGGVCSLHSHMGGGGGADVKSGKESVIPEGATRTITFVTPFVATPHVVVGFGDTSTEDSGCSAVLPTVNGFTIQVTKMGGGASKNRDVFWVATSAGNN